MNQETSDSIISKELFYILGVCLIGRVDENLYGISYGWDDTTINILLITFEGVPIVAYDLLVQDIQDEMKTSNFDHTIIFNIASVKDKPKVLRAWAFKRSSV